MEGRGEEGKKVGNKKKKKKGSECLSEQVRRVSETGQDYISDDNRSITSNIKMYVYMYIYIFINCLIHMV